MSSTKRTLLRILLAANGSCGCARPKPTDVFEPEPKPNHRGPNPIGSLTSSTTTSGDPNGAHSVDEDDGDFTSTNASEAETETQRSWKNASNMLPKQSPLVDSVAVEKESEDPYKDFRHSMLQMIFEKEMYSESDLEELLEAFLELNSPRQHEVIVKAFTEICQDAFPDNNNNNNKTTTTRRSKGKEISFYGHVRKLPLARALAM
ncbi:transcription repressor OFP8-like [Prosopis cineraria]|uniref:transcription repressor OFP8-like n=1 Tax=Prosopis cineraria TaxID=364024 RepID=UPI0024105B6E|nr:transcription repressor OFP8-like [Prosopis cineraria]